MEKILTIGAIILSKWLEISSVGQLQAETMRRSRRSQNNNCEAFVGCFNGYVFAFFRLFSTDHSSEERLDNLVLRLNLSLLISWRHFLMKKSKDENWPSGGVHLDFRIWSVSKVSLFEVLESSSLS